MLLRFAGIDCPLHTPVRPFTRSCHKGQQTYTECNDSEAIMTKELNSIIRLLRVPR
eukprot:jgi/Botrbrau1/2900/Bobra.0036s0041.1